MPQCDKRVREVWMRVIRYSYSLERLGMQRSAYQQIRVRWRSTGLLDETLFMWSGDYSSSFFLNG
jgi:hypothetical protein